jgi:D-arabinose 5-phosphate isomerase GutQ
MLMRNNDVSMWRIIMHTNAWDAAVAAYDIEAGAIKNAITGLKKDDFARAVDALAAAPRIASSGCGHSGIACMHFAHLMCCIERPARFIPPSEAVHGGTGFLQSGDVMLLASRGGKTAELLPILDICKKKSVTVISVTENQDSPLARDSDIVLRMLVTRETDKYNSQGTTSFTVLSVLFDALQAALIEVTDFRNERFAVIHPGGAVGEHLNNSK